MRVLLDTNIVIHRENHRISNYSIGHLFNWLDKLNCEKIIHPYTLDELKKFGDSSKTELLGIKLQAYNVLKTVKVPDEEFLSIIGGGGNIPNDRIDNSLLYEVFLGRVDVLITEDKGIKRKANLLGIENKVASIDEFLYVVTNAHPELVDYKFLSVKKELFGDLDIDNDFFQSLKENYDGFENWFYKKCDEPVYVCRDDEDILGLLYLKVEDEHENYSDISPIFKPAKRLKVGTFKVESTGFRLGERFIKIIFDNARKAKVDEIYLTMFEGEQEIMTLKNLLLDWGFKEYGHKNSNGKQELVLTKQMNRYDYSLSVKQNYPYVLRDAQKFLLPIYSKYHTNLLPDSQLVTENEEDFTAKLPHRYALEKVYISFSGARNINPGDLVIFYRMGEEGSYKKYKSVVTTVGVVEEISYDFKNKEEFLKQCKNRSVFSKEELDYFWDRKRTSLLVVKFIYLESLKSRLNLDYLWRNGIIEPPNGPRPFTRITDSDFDRILGDSQTELSFIEE